jgi:phosphoribosylamine-glycine ligase
MISIIGLGSAASKIAEKFKQTKNYNVYTMNSGVQRNSKYKYKLKTYDSAEEYEKNIPNVKKFLSELDEHVQFFIVGSSFSSNYSLGILQQIKDKKVDVFYVQPDAELMTGVPKLLDKIVFSVLQQYARSGLLKSFTPISNVLVEKSIGDIPIKTYYDKLNDSIFSTIHYINYFSHADPEIGMVAKPLDINRIR